MSHKLLTCTLRVMPGPKSLAQFSLKCLFLLVTGIALALGNWVNGARKQKALIKGVESQGGGVGYERDDVKSSRLRSWIEAALGKDYVLSVVWVQMRMALELL